MFVLIYIKKFVCGHYISFTFHRTEPIHNKIYKLLPSEDSTDQTSLDLGSPPRDRYPLVVFLADLEILNSDNTEEIMAMQQIVSWIIILLFHFLWLSF